MKRRTIIIALTIILIATIIFKEKFIFFYNYATMNKPLKNPPAGLISILSANVGNLDLSCRSVLNKLCHKDVEERISANIRRLAPDIVLLQEVLAPWQCMGKEKDNDKVCYEEQTTPQVRRLIGDNYTIVCNSRNQFECIAVKTSIGLILGCQPGSLCNNARTLPETDGCDNGFTISAATIKLLHTNLTFDIVNFHPQSTSSSCRAKMISVAITGNQLTPSLIQENNVILAGDFNLDPWRDRDESAVVWNNLYSNGWNEKKFRYHSGIVEKTPPYFTSFLFYRKRTLDFIVSNFASGTCTVLGESPNTERLDGGRGTDHRAIFGFLKISTQE